jgi:trk system potassium uptake protein TrkA
MPLSTGRFAIIGAGEYGSAIAKTLANKGAEVYIYDYDERKIENIKDDVALAVVLDASDREALKSQNIHLCDTIVVTIGDNFEAVILCCVNLLELNAPRIMARASGNKQRTILEKIGILEILTPEQEVANVVTEKLINPSIVNSLMLPDGYEIVEAKVPPTLISQTVAEINFRDKYELTLITIKREFISEETEGKEKREQHIIGVPSSNSVLQEYDTLVLFGTKKNIERLIDINQ